MEFVNTNDDRINISPENNERLALPLREQPQEFITDVNLKFDFFKKKFTYKFFGLNNLFDQIGGAASAAAGFVKKFASYFLLLFILQFGMKIEKMHNELHKEFIEETYRPKLPLYKKIVEKKLLEDDTN